MSTRTPLRALLVEDSEQDAQLLLRALQRDGFEPDFQRVQTAPEMHAALTTQAWDIVLCDNFVPGFDALAALHLLQKTGFDPPFIIVSGRMDEEQAVAAMKLGATDYLLKDRLARLGITVTQALEQRRHRREREQTAAAARANDARLREFSAHVPAIIFVKDVAGRYLHVNPVFEEKFRLTSAAVIGKTDAEIFSPEQAAVFQANDRKVLQMGAALEFEERANYFDGPHISLVSKFPLHDADGKIAGVCGFATDITERKRTEEKLRAAQETVQTLLDSAPVAILGLGLQGRVTKWNAGAARMFGWDETEVLGSICPTVPADGKEDFLAMIQRVVQQGPQTGMIYPRQKKSGERIHASISAAPLRDAAGHVTGLMVILEDVTERLRLQEALQQTADEQRELAQQLATEKARLLTAQAVAKIGSWETEIETGAVAWSNETHRIFETDPRTFRPTHAAFLQLLHPDERARVEEAFVRSHAVREPGVIEHRLAMADGRSKIIEERWHVFFDDRGQPLRAIGTSQDITDRKQAEQALRESEARLFQAFRSSPVSLTIQRWSDRKFVDVNAAFSQLTGWARDELIGHTILERQLTEPSTLRKLLEQFGGTRALRDAEVAIKTRGGEVRHVLMGAEFIELHGEPHAVCTFFDVTDRQRAEQALRASEARYRTLFEYAPDGIMISDAPGVFLDANASMCRMLGYTREELLRLKNTDIIVPGQAVAIEPALSAIRSHIDHHQVWQLRRHDGSIFPAEILATQMPDGNLLGMIRDISVRQAHEQEIVRLSRLYAALSHTNQAIVAAPSRDELFTMICRALVEFGGFRMAWIGWVKAETRQLIPVGQWGDDMNYLSQIKIFADDRPEGRGPAGRAIREGKTCISNDFFHEPAAAPWREMVVQAGFRAAAAIPIRERGAVAGAILVYSTEQGFFQDKEIALLEEAAADVCFGIDNLAREAARQQAEAELRAAEQQLHALVGRLHSVREDEAKRIARELHDDLGQRLTALNMELGGLEAKLPGATPAQRQQIARMRAGVDHTIEVVQKISGELRLGQLDMLGLSAAIEWHLQEFSQRSALPCKITRLDEFAHLSDAQSTAVFRILQEALTNIARHAAATAVEVSLAAAPDALTLRVHDNGRGITEAEMKDRKAIGLLGMRERAQIVGGTVTLTGGPGVGTTVLVRIPLKLPAAFSP